MANGLSRPILMLSAILVVSCAAITFKSLMYFLNLPARRAVASIRASLRFKALKTPTGEAQTVEERQDDKITQEEDRKTRMERLTLRMSVIQTYIAVISFIVALIALYAALNEADSVRKQQQASAWPRLEFELSYRTVPGSEQFEINLRNSGLGPALIESIELSLDDKPLQNWDQLVQTFTDVESPLYSYNWVSNRVMRPDDRYALLTVTADEIDSETIVGLQKAADSGRIKGQICYCSVFEDCWRLETESRTPTEVESCPAISGKNEF